jgi:hypothetical protein
MLQVIEAGGHDRDLPAFEGATGFFDAPAVSVTYNLGEPPGFLAERPFSGWEIVCECSGESRQADAEDIGCWHIRLGYGEGPFDNLDLPCAGGPWSVA